MPNRVFVINTSSPEQMQKSVWFNSVILNARERIALREWSSVITNWPQIKLEDTAELHQVPIVY